MRLLDTDTLTFHEFFDKDIPEYAIASHTWGDGEVTYKDWVDSTVSVKPTVDSDTGKLGRPTVVVSDPASSCKGLTKLLGLCDKAREEGFSWVWIDTCCIDKSSSAELSEAINSMYNWYKKAALCYVHLSDVGSNENPSVEGSGFRKSRWFTRGWTLQELIAPSEVVFLASDWIEIGTRHQLSDLVSSITSIPADVLQLTDMKTYSCAQRMAWASQRKTTRLEDEAYCLMGLFEVHMPLLYGEGRHAFTRLQEAILNSYDRTATTHFAWHRYDDQFKDPLLLTGSTGLLADSPCCFSNSGEFEGLCLENSASGPSTTADSRKITFLAPSFPLPYWSDPTNPYFDKHEKGSYLKPNVLYHLLRTSMVFNIHRQHQVITLNNCYVTGQLVLVATLSQFCNIDTDRQKLTCKSRHIGIILERSPGGDLLRSHFPPLVEVELHEGACLDSRGSPDAWIERELTSRPHERLSVMTEWQNPPSFRIESPVVKAVPSGCKIVATGKALLGSSALPEKSVEFRLDYFGRHSHDAIEFRTDFSSLPFFTVVFEWTAQAYIVRKHLSDIGSSRDWAGCSAKLSRGSNRIVISNDKCVNLKLRLCRQGTSEFLICHLGIETPTPVFPAIKVRNQACCYVESLWFNQNVTDIPS